MRDNRLVRKKAAGKGNGQSYASGECQKTGLSETQVVFCPKCKKKHYSAYALMNEFVNCECGYSFYAFADKGLHIMIPAQETRIDQIVRAMRRFVVTTGRCRPEEAHEKKKRHRQRSAVPRWPHSFLLRDGLLR